MTRTNHHVAHARTHQLAAVSRTHAGAPGETTSETVSMECLLQILVRAVTAKDAVTGTHLERLAEYAQLVGRAFGLSEDDLDVLRYGALLHDIGKIGIADQILRKPGPLTSDEYLQIQQHPVIGAWIVEPLGMPAIAAIVRHHHERWDGQGYPDHLAGERIPLGARIIAVLDAFDAMTSTRPYTQPLTDVEAIVCLETGAGSRWDPDVVAALICCLGETSGGQERAVGESFKPGHVIDFQQAISRMRAVA